jgi:hypothetical protein
METLILMAKMESQMKKNNWYKRAAEWYKFAPSVTLFHGTNENSLQTILKNGFNSIKPETLINQILSKYNLSKKDIPDYIWKEELNYRKENPYIHFTTSKEQAKEYARNSLQAGEFENTIIQLLKEWLEKEKQIKIDIPVYKPVVITVDVPWDKVKTHKSMSELKEVINNVIKNKDELLMENESIEAFLSNLGFEFMISDTLPKDYIIKYDFI